VNVFRYPLWVCALPAAVEGMASLVYMTVGFPSWAMWGIHGLAWGFTAWLWVAAIRQRRQLKQLIKWMEAYHRLIAPPFSASIAENGGKIAPPDEEGGRRIGGGD
jgi:hypothetical protein